MKSLSTKGVPKSSASPVHTILIAFMLLCLTVSAIPLQAQQAGGIKDEIAWATDDLITVGRKLAYHAQGSTQADKVAIESALLDGGVSSDHLAGIINDALSDPLYKDYISLLQQMGGLSSFIGANIIAADDAYWQSDYATLIQEGINIQTNATAIANLALQIR